MTNQSTHEDYTQDGLLFCGKCHTPKQCVVPYPDFYGTGEFTEKVVPVLCQCARAEKERVDKYYRDEERKLKMNHLMRTGFAEKDLLRTVRFEDADADSENLDKAQKYVDKFADFCKDGIGLMLYGNVGNGKTFAAACIANALIDKLVPVAFFSTATFLDMTFEDRDWVLANHKQFGLLVLDDFGVERATEYGMEQIYNLVDSRYKSGLPMIVTTNKLPSELENETDIAKKRINDRVLEMCLPVQFKHESRRKARKAEKMASAKKFFA